ncbi:hypothetical protein HDC92_005007 [Pedobacter sp. AK017]|uniref:DUF4623 domain-containing protein n=1 Tax=Pedobacter sp. AK017 TaxID=2723073 RepID=UPI0016228EDC|nr:DUF4623 domain-containing protein [Pedobacter sp. AK017]MBB5441300.1 hypothetical protein [Pedobacter sp. AK017]
MKLTYKTSKTGLLATFMGLLILASCKDDYPVAPDTSSNMTVLNSIKLMNAGANGATVLQGVVDENTKTVTFPRIEPGTDFSNLKFEADLSPGAKLNQETYPVTFEEGQTEKVIVLKVLNSPRYREYLVKLRLKVPVFGADFENKTTYDFTSNPLGNPIYDAFTGALTRGSGFDGQQVLIVRREAPHLLNVSELKTGVINKIPLNITGVTLGTFTLNMGAQINGHTYIANLSGNTAGSPLKIYHWTNPSLAPQVITDINVGTITGAGVRYGDNFSASLDNLGNGYFFFGDNAGTKILRFDVANYTTVTNPTAFAIPVAAAGSWTSYNRIGNTSEYLFTGHDAPVALVSEGGTAAFTMSRTAIPVRGSDARVVYFNGERYLIVTTAARTGAEATNFIVYDITKGENVKDALTNLNAQALVKPVFEYSLMGPVNTSPASQTGFYVKKDAMGNDVSLMLYAAASDAGFVFFEFQKKVALD